MILLPSIKIAPVLFVHSQLQPFDFQISRGSITSMNKLDCEKSGVYSFELNEKLIKNAKIIVLDCHWIFSLAGIGEQINEIKMINPKAFIIIGGLTASGIGRALISEFPVDYIIVGDSEKSFVKVVNNILNNDESNFVPNVYSKKNNKFEYVWDSKDEFNDVNEINCQWFPGYYNLITNNNFFYSKYNESANYIMPLFSFTNGCILDCPNCENKRSDNSMGKRINLKSPMMFKSFLDMASKECINAISFYSTHLTIDEQEEFIKFEFGKFNFDHIFFYLCGVPLIPFIEKIKKIFNKNLFISIGLPGKYFLEIDQIFNRSVNQFKKEIIDYSGKSKINLRFYFTNSIREKYFKSMKNIINPIIYDFGWINDLPVAKTNWNNNKFLQINNYKKLYNFWKSLIPLKFSQLLNPTLMDIINEYSDLQDTINKPDLIAESKKLSAFIDILKKTYKKKKYPVFRYSKYIELKWILIPIEVNENNNIKFHESVTNLSDDHFVKIYYNNIFLKHLNTSSNNRIYLNLGINYKGLFGKCTINLSRFKSVKFNAFAIIPEISLIFKKIDLLNDNKANMLFFNIPSNFDLNGSIDIYIQYHNNFDCCITCKQNDKLISFGIIFNLIYKTLSKEYLANYLHSIAVLSELDLENLINENILNKELSEQLLKNNEIIDKNNYNQYPILGERLLKNLYDCLSSDFTKEILYPWEIVSIKIVSKIIFLKIKNLKISSSCKILFMGNFKEKKLLKLDSLIDILYSFDNNENCSFKEIYDKLKVIWFNHKSNKY